MMASNQIGTEEKSYHCDYREVESLVHEVYGSTIPELNRRNYSFVETQECNNYTSHEFDINGKLDKMDMNDWETRRFQYRNRLILNKLCADGYIEVGNYVIKVSW